MKSLLPPNSTKLERKIAESNSSAFDMCSIRVMKDIDNVPAHFLPFIAYQHSVDFWDVNWQESLKRESIKASKSQHKIKGTVIAIRNALKIFGYEVKIIEWFQVQPNLIPGTFNIEIDLIGKILDKEVFDEVNRLISDAKSASRHLVNLSIISNPVLSLKNILVHQSALTFLSLPRN